jgi:hypothetical protein
MNNFSAGRTKNFQYFTQYWSKSPVEPISLCRRMPRMTSQNTCRYKTPPPLFLSPISLFCRCPWVGVFNEQVKMRGKLLSLYVCPDVIIENPTLYYSRFILPSGQNFIKLKHAVPLLAKL